mmetsp:Transcript_24051/g.37091  ORF Transcript_24051/g.37091 Transcript_24051/m.37091 type:complete len:412 (+) Transcript_24051:258-1493(+)
MKISHLIFLLASPKSTMKKETSDPTISDHYRAVEMANAPIVHAVGGAVGSALSLLLLYPLDRARIEMQSRVTSMKHSSRGRASSAQTLPRVDENMEAGCDSGTLDLMTENAPEQKYTVRDCLSDLYCKGELYRGVAPVVFSLAVSNFVFFYAHEAVKKSLFGKNTRIGAGRALLASTLAGAINVLLTNPLWVANVRIQTAGGYDRTKTNDDLCSMGGSNERKISSSLISEMARIMKDEGFFKLWSGTAVSLLLCSNPAIQLFLYERMKNEVLSVKRFRQKEVHSSLGMIEAFLIGAIAKAISTVTTYPLQLAQVLVRLQRETRLLPSEKVVRGRRSSEMVCEKPEHYLGSIDCLRKLWAKGGFKSWFSGIDAKLLQTVLSAALTFLTYEQILGVVRKAMISLVLAKQGNVR